MPHPQMEKYTDINGVGGYSVYRYVCIYCLGL